MSDMGDDMAIDEKRSRCLLYKYPDDWTDIQQQRALTPFKRYPEIEKSYNRSCDFRTWHRKENVGKSKEIMRKELKQ